MERVVLHINNSTNAELLQSKLNDAGIDYEIIEDEILKLCVNNKIYKFNEAIKWIRMKGND